MNEEFIKFLKEGINKIIDKDLDEDLDNGYKLLELCNKYKPFNKYYSTYICKTNSHQQDVVSFINNIKERYSILIRSYNFLNASVSSNNDNNTTNCQSLQIYVAFLERVKKLKNAFDKGKSDNELIKILKGESNE